ncbi:uncharacterized protein [Spinacia oleracea]|uniref:Transposase-associated domain-containing protein n=1 Tax=Spinacia oleracea TaxID=3562 RepID=A0ABM3RIN5_SPIOL|nr:uncharacterized protein LOC110788416 [Spinacia oleracea]
MSEIMASKAGVPESGRRAHIVLLRPAKSADSKNASKRVEMDRSWITTTKIGDPKYDAGVMQFIKFALENNSEGRDKFPCPCYMCHNLMHHKVDVILSHLRKWEFDITYTCWYRHGEKMGGTSGQQGHTDEGDSLEDMMDQLHEEVDDDPHVLEELLTDSEKPLYKDSKYSKLSAIVKLYNVKVGHSVTDECFSAFLKLFKDILPPDNVLHGATYRAKKMLCTTDLNYEKIHAFPNDCILYKDEYESLKNCPQCNVSRYKKKEGVPAKVLWYFPIISRFKRMYSNSEDAKRLTWHKFGREKEDGILRHPADSPQWRFIYAEFSDFGKEERNLRLGLSTDGMNPYSSISSTYSIWPVMLVAYNLPPSLCLKRKYIMLSMLISGPKQPGNDIDVYLTPLIDDLKLLWEKGVEVFDASRNEMINLRPMLFCTIQDYPAYSNLSGHTVKGRCACPICEDGWEGRWLSPSKKTVYYDHRPFLPEDHEYRKLKKAFTGEQNFESRPSVSTGEEVFEKVKNIQITFGKLKKNKGALPKQGYKKCSVFWRLPYWRFLFVRHSLDVMHIEKNVFDSLIGTLLNMPGKTKDGLNARSDLEELDIRKELHIVEETGKRKYLPPAAYTLSKKEKIELCTSLAGVKVPEGYSSNISSLVSVENTKLVGLKSHDCHVLMEDFLPIAIRSILPKNVRYEIIRLCFFFKSIYSKAIKTKDLDSLEIEIAVILCQLEMYFPPAFFDIMIHLPVHLVREIRFCGPVHMRAQWAFERQMKTYKGYAC